MSKDLQTAKLQLALLEKQKEYEDSLPHLFGFPHYKWSRDFFESTNRINVLCSANQIGKSSVAIRKCIHLATDVKSWPKIWRTRPKQFWYLYPTARVATVEFEMKWVTEFLPTGKMKDHPQYGWHAKYDGADISYIRFNSGVTVYFKSYTQNPQALQTSSVYALFCDEEVPAELYDELTLRMAATDGVAHFVFTPTLGQQFWYDVVEVRGQNERLPTAFKQNVSMYDCLKYEDGSASPWTIEKIRRIENACKSDAEIQRRVHGRFVSEQGLKYPGFSRTQNIIKPIKIPDDYLIFSGVDFGSGEGNHPSAVVFIAVSPNYDKGYIFSGKRFDDNGRMTVGDTIRETRTLRGNMDVITTYYDWSAVDALPIAMHSDPSGNWCQADKSHALGEQVLNVLFRNQMLFIFDTPELQKLAYELTSLKKDTPKVRAKDDFTDSTRYGTTKIPWDFSKITADSAYKASDKDRKKVNTELERRRAFALNLDESEDSGNDIEDEINFWNDLYDAV